MKEFTNVLREMNTVKPWPTKPYSGQPVSSFLYSYVHLFLVINTVCICLDGVKTVKFLCKVFCSMVNKKHPLTIL